MASLDVTVATPADAPVDGRVGVIVFRRAPADYYRMPVREEWSTSKQIRLENLAADRYLVFVRSERLAPSVSWPLTVAENDHSSIRLELQKPGTVRGRVLRAVDGAPVAGAVIYPASLAGVISTTSDQDGRFELAQVPRGEHALVIAHHSLVWKVLDGVRVGADQVTEPGDIRLLDGGRIEGILLRAPGNPIADEQIFLRCPYGPTKVSVTDSNGRFAFHGVPPGKSVVMKGLLLNERVARSVTVTEGSIATVELRLDTDQPIQGSVFVDGEPAAGVLVTAVHASPEKELDSFVMTVTDETGEFMLEGASMRNGPYLLTFMREIQGGFASFIDIVRPPTASANGGSSETTYTFPRGAITVALRDAQTQRLVEGAEIKAIPKGQIEGKAPDRFQRVFGGRSTSAVKTDAAGAFTLRHLADGRYSIIMSKDGYDSMTVEHNVRDGSNSNIGEVNLQPAGRVGAIDGRVYGPTGDPVRALMVLLRTDGTPVSRQTHSDLGGRFEFESVPEGVYKISAEGEVPAFTHVENIVVDRDERKSMVVNLAAP